LGVSVRRLHTLLAAGLAAGLVAGLVTGAKACQVESRNTGGAGAENGLAGLPAQQILAQATDAARNSTSVLIKGQVVQGGTTARLDLRLKGAAGGVGTVTLDKREFRVVRVGPELYVTGGRGAFPELGRAGALLEGKPVHVSAADPRFAEVAGFTDLRRILSLLLAPGAGLTKGDRGSQVNGRSALALLNAAGTGGTLWVATSGTPYPLRLDVPAASGSPTSGMLDFLEYGGPVVLTPPKGALDLAPPLRQ
jgi:hypothetical protein